MKKFLSGLLAGLLLSVVVSAYAETPSSISVIFDRVKLVVNGQSFDASTILYENKTYVPLRAFSDLMGYTLEWDGKTRTVAIDSQKTPTEISASEMYYIDSVFLYFEKIQPFLDDINYIIYSTDKPYDSYESITQVISLFNEIASFACPEPLSDYKAAVDYFCSVNEGVFSKAIAYIGDNPETSADFPEFFTSVYDSELLQSASADMDDALVDFLSQRTMGDKK